MNAFAIILAILVAVVSTNAAPQSNKLEIVPTPEPLISTLHTSATPSMGRKFQNLSMDI